MVSATGPMAAHHVAVGLAGRLVAWLNWEPTRRAEPDVSWSTPLAQQGWLCPSQAQLSWVGPKNPSPAEAHCTEAEAEPSLLWLVPGPKWGQSWWLGAGHEGLVLISAADLAEDTERDSWAERYSDTSCSEFPVCSQKLTFEAFCCLQMALFWEGKKKKKASPKLKFTLKISQVDGGLPGGGLDHGMLEIAPDELSPPASPSQG